MTFTLTLAAKAPLVAYPALVAANVVNKKESEAPIDVKLVDDTVLDKTSKSTVQFENASGTEAVVNAIVEKFPYLSPSSECQPWVSWAVEQLTVKDFKALTPVLEKLESHLNFRSYLVGYKPTIADITVWGVLRSNGVVGGAIKSGTFINIARWYNRFFEYHAMVDKMVKDLNDQRKSSGKKEHKGASFDIDLVGAEMGKVVTRFPPEPSGYLHIGHAKAAILNQYFATAYKGKLILRFDDTNPSKEKEEFEESIIADLKLLGIHEDMVSHSSDYFQEMYDYAVQLIKEGKAYCDDTELETMREQRGEGIASKRRDRTVEENLKVFEQDMGQGTEEGLKNCLRAKVSVDNPNKAMRDPVIYRCNLTPHVRTGTKWKMYPTYDFCVPIVDSLEGVTHALRTTEYRDRNAQYEWFLKALNLRWVHVWDFSRINFMRTLLSKRKLQWFVDNGRVSGWDDPRFPTVRGVRRRGMTIEGLHAFIIAQGPSKNVLNLEWSSIWATNKKVIDPKVPRYGAVDKDSAVRVTIQGAEKHVEKRAKHKKNAELGQKDMVFGPQILIEGEDAKLLKDNEEVTLMDWGNAIVQKIEKDGDNVKSVEMKLHLEGDFKTTEKKLTWLADTDDVTPCELVDFEHLITKDKIEEEEDFADFLTPQTEFHKDAYGDLNIKQLKQGDIIQFERKGYYRLDKPWSEGSKAVFFTIPDGKTVSRYGAKSS